MIPGRLYSKTSGRVHVDVDPDHMGSSRVHVLNGYNDGCSWVQNNLSIEEMRDLRYLLDRGIAAAESYEAKPK